MKKSNDDIYEISNTQIKNLIDLADFKKTDVFYDLGSGTGKAVILASLFGDFSKLVGIEEIEDLHRASVDIFRRYETEVKPILPSEKQKQVIELVNSDFLEFDISEADLIFAHSTCFYDELMIALEKKCALLRKGTKLILVTKNFNSPLFEPLKSSEYPMSWGKATVNFYEKL